MSVVGKMMATTTTSISDLRNPSLWVEDMFAGGRTTAGVIVTPSRAMSLSTYYACMRTISQDVAKLPIKIVRQIGDGDQKKLRDHPLVRLLNLQPNPETIAMTMRELLTFWAMSWGAGFAEIERSVEGKVLALHPIHPTRVRIIRDRDTGKLFYRIASGSNDTRKPGILRAADMLHIRHWADQSILANAMQSLGVSLATQEFTSSFFANGTHIGSIIEMDGTLKEPARKNFLESWTKSFQGAKKAGSWALLEGGMKWKPMSIPPDQAQLLETQFLQIEEIARWCNITPYKIGHMKDAKFKNVESLNKEYADVTLTPHLIRWEQEIKIKLLGDEEDVSAKHVLQALLRGSASDRTALYKMMWMVGAMSANDILKLEDSNGIGEMGDLRFVPLNMQVLQDIGKDDDDDPDNDDDDEPNDSFKGIPDENEGVPRRDDMDSAHIESAQRVLADCIEGVLRRELNAVSRATKTHTGYEFLNWMDEFYSSEAHTEKMTERLREVYPSLCSLLGITDQGVVAEMVEEYGTDSKYTLSLCANTEQIQEQLEQWRTKKAQQYATQWLSI